MSAMVTIQPGRITGVVVGEFVRCASPSGRSVTCRVVHVWANGEVTITAASTTERLWLWLKRTAGRLIPHRAWVWWVTR